MNTEYPFAVSRQLKNYEFTVNLTLLYLLVRLEEWMPRKFDRSRELQRCAERIIPGGVNSPVRAFGSVGGEPPFIVRGQGSHMWDADENEYIDYVGSWGPLILGHAAPE